LDILTGKVKSEFGIVTDTINDVDIARVVMKKDSVVLPQASVKVFAKILMDSWMEQSTDPYRDYYLTNRIYRDDGHTIGSKLDTMPVDINSVAPQPVQTFEPDKIVAYDEWAFFTSPTINGMPQINYPYGFIAVRKTISVGIIPTLGEKKSVYTEFGDFKRRMNYLNPHAFDPFEQSLNALFYKKYEIKNFHDDWDY
jgi:hypothetical protein